ncbi:MULTISPECIES: hypothetical protein [unclassified Carboxylicivirga]|uniref:hypothetical protein n=1 Tax=Carboxylicivirga TaxID=1628153 RepID=UPI003D340569
MYGLELFYEWKSKNGISNRVEIRDASKATDSGALEVYSGYEPFRVEYPEVKLGYEPIRSCGATLTFVYKGSEGYLDNFFTSELKRFKVVHYRDGAVNFIGYLNTELYEEDYSISTEVGVEVMLTANNGFSITDRLNYIQDNGDYYYGIDNIRDVFARIFNAIGLEYENLYLTTLFDLVIDDEQGTLSSNYLADEYINNANWIDEDFETSSIREVLENILIANGVYLITKEDDIYILPIERQAKANSANSFYHYILPDLSKQGNKNVDLSAVEISAIGYRGTGQGKSKLTAINSQDLEYDPYCIEYIFDGVVGDVGKYLNKTGNSNYPHKEFPWSTENYSHHVNYINYNVYDSQFVMAYPDDEGLGKAEYYFEWAPPADNTQVPVLESKQQPIHLMNGSNIRIGFRFYYQTADSWMNNADDGISDGYFPKVTFALKCGDKFYNRDTNTLEDKPQYLFASPPENFQLPRRNGCDMMLDAEVDFNFFVGENSATAYNGQPLSVVISSSVWTGSFNFSSPLPDKLRIYDISIDIVDTTASFYNTDLSSLVKSSELKLDSSYKNKGHKIETRIGTLLKEPDFKVSNPNQRGAIFHSADGINFFAITTFQKDGISASSSEYWVLKQIVDNYATPCNVLKVRLNTFDMLRPVKDTSYLGNCIMVAAGGVIDYQDDTIHTTLQEVKPMT